LDKLIKINKNMAKESISLNNKYIKAPTTMDINHLVVKLGKMEYILEAFIMVYDREVDNLNGIMGKCLKVLGKMG
jgi:hypothetical protein